VVIIHHNTKKKIAYKSQIIYLAFSCYNYTINILW